MQIFVPEYWPLFKTDERRRFDYVASDGSALRFTSVFSYDARSDSMVYENLDSSGGWLNTWLYRYKPGSGIVEWQDRSPQSGILAILFGRIQKVVMSTPIGWGERAEVGDTYISYPAIDFFRSRPPRSGTGFHYVNFEDFQSSFTLSNGDAYSDVLMFSAVQVWDGKTDALRFWMAKGVGPVAVQFIETNRTTGLPTETVRFDRLPRTAIIA